ncbi:hypothetical protein G7Z17_g3534 [Cylindrodendrum hubeiense]|uniref:DUF7580 domain-containing protein n=1 Tax=Cylindrodendrum hubeiense TaxID=595255 RepID=A0A9P5HFL6_9HYPO|nr:hypothetical protein G7Z17_g3534 [Cylindrodendrum hubeiense]
MSGLEVVGIALGTIPLLVSALDAYCSLMRDWGKAPSELKSLNRQLTTERAKLYNVCDQLINDVVPQRDIEPMLQDPFGPLWQAKETNDKIRQRLWKSKDYQDALDTISRGISDLEGFARLSLTLEPSRRKQSRGKLFTVLRDLSTSIYRALCSSILCTDSHDISFELATRFIDVGHIGDDEKILRNAQFKVAISFEMADGPASKRFWDELNIRTATSSIEEPPKPYSMANEPKKIKAVSFSLDEKLSFVSHAKPPPDIKNGIAILTRSVTGIASVQMPHGFGQPTGLPLDLCMAMKSGHKTHPVSYGHLIDKQCIGRHFQVYPLGTTANSDAWSIISLHDVLGGKKGLRPLISLVEKVQLALVIASSVLQLSKTPWLPEGLTRKNVHFFRRGGIPSYEHPFILRSLSGSSPPSPATNFTATRTQHMLMSNPTLFALGILLLEIILGSTLDELRESDEKEYEGDDLGIIRDSITAHRLLERRVALINPIYKAVVERCIGCTEPKGLDEDGFRQEVYNGVIMELEAIVNHTKLGV